MTKTSADAILWPFSHTLTLPLPNDRVFYAGAREAEGLQDLVEGQGQWVLLQPFKPWADRLRLPVKTEWPEGFFSHALVLAGRQAEETRALLAKAALNTVDDGWIVCAGDNDSGGKRIESYYTALGLHAEAQSKHHARVVWAQKKKASFLAPEAEKWAKTGDIRLCETTGLYSCPGLFAWDRIDDGSAALLQHLPGDLKGIGADFGCGTGVLSRSLLQKNDQIKTLHCLDADSRALQACRMNLQGFKTSVVYEWADLTCETVGAKTLDWIVMNPPFHEGKATDSDIGAAFVRTAAASLKRGGALYMVANSHLPYEKVLTKHFGRVEKTHEARGFKIYRAVRQG